MNTDYSVTKKYKLLIFLALLISIVVFISLYIPIDSHTFRGELWELLAIENLNLTFIDKFNAISNFVCFGSGRFQPLAFFVPFYQTKLLNSSFFAVHIFAQTIHLICSAGVAYIALMWTGNRYLGMIVFLLSLFSFLASDVVMWNFFTYIQLHALILILCVYLNYIYYKTYHFRYYLLASFLGLISTFLYEAAVSILLTQIFFAIIRIKNIEWKTLFLEILIPSLFIIIYAFVSFYINGFNYKDSNTSFHPLILIKPILYLIYYFRYNLGLSVEAEILNIGWISKLNIELSFLNWLIISIILVNLVAFKGALKNKVLDKNILFLIILIYFYILIIGFGRVPVGSALFQPTGLETQFRYYYVSNFFIPLIVCLIVNKFKLEIKKLYIVLFLVSLVLLGNIINIFKYVNLVASYNEPLTIHAKTIINNQLEVYGTQWRQEFFWKEMHQDWYEEKIPTPDLYRPFTFNANTCKSHAEYIRQK